MSNLDSLTLGKSLALIGPSPHLQGKGLGNYFDSFDLIARVNDVVSVLQPNDYGSRTDIVFVGSTDAETIRGILEGTPKGIAQPQLIVYPRHGLPGDDSLPPLSSRLPKPGVQITGLSMGHTHHERFPKSPSTGFLSILLTSELDLGKLFIGGFSFYSTLRAYNWSNSSHKRATGFRAITVSGHTTDQEVSYLKTTLNPSKVFTDAKFRRLVFEDGYRGKNLLVFSVQVIRNSLAGLVFRARDRLIKTEDK